jgi:hypothetical protein
VLDGELRHLEPPVRSDLLDPLRNATMEHAALGARQGGVGDVPGERVLEHEFAHARQRGRPFRDESTRYKRERRLVAHADGGRPEDTADYGRTAQRVALVRIEEIDPCCEHAVHRVGERQLGRVAVRLPGAVHPHEHPALDQHREHLLDEERVPFRALEHPAAESPERAVAAEERVDEGGGIVGSERRERQRRRVVLARTPVGSQLEQLRPRGADDQDRGVGQRVGEAVDQVEERGRRPVNVLDREDRRPAACEVGEVSPPGVLERLRHLARGETAGKIEADSPEDGREHARGVGADDLLDVQPELLARRRGRVGVEDARVRFHGFGERPIGDVLTVRQAAALEHRRLRQPRDELGKQARLAHPRRAQERDQLWCTFPHDAARDRRQDRQLVGSRDQRRTQPRDASRRGLDRDGLRRPGCDSRALPFRVEPPFRAVCDGSQGRALGPLADEHLSGVGRLLQARGDVCRVAAHHQLPARRAVATRDDLARVDPDPKADVHAVAVGDRRRECAERRLGGERCTHGPLGIVLVRAWDPEHGQNRVADELLGDAAETFDLGVDEPEEPALDVTHVLRVETLAERGRARQIGEQDRDDPPFLPLVDPGGPAAGIATQRGAAVRAKRRRRRLFLAAARAAGVQRRATRAAESCSRLLGGSAVCARDLHRARV